MSCCSCLTAGPGIDGQQEVLWESAWSVAQSASLTPKQTPTASVVTFIHHCIMKLLPGSGLFSLVVIVTSASAPLPSSLPSSDPILQKQSQLAGIGGRMS